MLKGIPEVLVLAKSSEVVMVGLLWLVVVLALILLPGSGLVLLVLLELAPLFVFALLDCSPEAAKELLGPAGCCWCWWR